MIMTITLKDVGSGFKRTAINENFDTIKAEINDNLLSKLGGKQLEADLDMNSNNLLNTSTVYASNLVLNGTQVSTNPLEATNVVKTYPTLAAATAATDLVVGDEVSLAERTTGNGGGAAWDVVLTSSVTPNTYNVVQCTGVAALALVLRHTSEINVTHLGAVGDWNGTTGTDNTLIIQFAIDTLFAAGGGTVYLPQGNYYITAPIEMKLYVNFIGESRSTVLTKTNAATTGGIDCVLYALVAGRFQIKNLRLVGNRSSRVATSHGIYFTQVEYFKIENIRITECLIGCYLRTSYIGSIDNVTASMCQGYSFQTESACTSLHFSNCVAWTSGGGYNITGTVYSTFTSCAADNLDSYGSDPAFATAGGDYQNPAFVYRLSGSQGITFISCGTESSYSKYLYCEGATATFIDCYAFGLECNATTYDLISLRGTSLSNVKFINPYFTGVTNALASSATIKGIFVENPIKQRLQIEGNLQIDPSFGTQSYDTDGLNYTYDVDLLDLNQTSMIIGQDAPFVRPATDIATVVLSGTDKLLNIDSVTGNVVNFDLLLPDDGIFFVQFTGTYASSYGAAILQIIEYNGVTTNVLKSWTNAGGALTADERFFLAAQTGYDLYFRITTNHTTDVMNFSKMKIKCAESQV